MEAYMESVKAFKFMNGWIVKRKHIDAVKDAIFINRTVALEGLYVYGWAVKVNGVFWATVENGREFDEEVEEIKKSFFAY